MCARSPAPTARASSSRLRAPPRCGSGCRSRRGSNTPIFRRALARARRPRARQGRSARGAARQMRTDGTSALECDFDGSVGTLVRAVKGRLLLPAGKPPDLAAELSGIDVAQALALARAKALPSTSSNLLKGKFPSRPRWASGERWRVDLRHREVRRRDQARPAAVEALAARRAGEHFERARDRLGAGRLRGEIHVLRGCRGHRPGRQAPRRRPPAARGSSSRSGSPGCERRCRSRKSLSLSGQADVALNRLALRFDRPAEAEFDAVVTPRKVSAAVKALPVPVSVTGGSVRAGRSRVLLRDLAGSLGIPRSAISTRRSSSGRRRSCRRRRGVRASSSSSGFPGCGEVAVRGRGIGLGAGRRGAHRLALRFDRPAEADYEVVVTPRKVERRSQGAARPGRRWTRGSVRVGRQQLRLKTWRWRCSTHGRCVSERPDPRIPRSGRDCRRHGRREDRALGARARRGPGAARAQNAAALRSAAHCLGPGGAGRARGRCPRRVRRRPGARGSALVAARGARVAAHSDQGRAQRRGALGAEWPASASRRAFPARCTAPASPRC